MWLVAMFFLISSPAEMAPPCAAHDQLLADLERSEGKIVRAHAVTDDGGLFEVAISENGDVSLIITYIEGITIRANNGVYRYPPGTSCVALEGHGWETLIPTQAI